MKGLVYFQSGVPFKTQIILKIEKYGAMVKKSPPLVLPGHSQPELKHP